MCVCVCVLCTKILAVAHNIFDFFHTCKRLRIHIVNKHYLKRVLTEKSKPRQTLDPCSVSIF